MERGDSRVINAKVNMEACKEAMDSVSIEIKSTIAGLSIKTHISRSAMSR